MVLTDTEVQNTLDAAITLVVEVLDEEEQKENNDLTILRLTIVLSSFLTLKMLSKSSNGIPSLRGLGLDEGLTLARHFIAEGVNIRTLSFNHRSLFESIEIVKR